MDFNKIFNTLAEGAACYKGYKNDYWDGVEDCSHEIIDSLVCATIMTTREAKEIKDYVAELREHLFDEQSDF